MLASTIRACRPECCNHRQDEKQNSQILPTKENYASCGGPSPDKHKHARHSNIHRHDYDDYEDYDNYDDFDPCDDCNDYDDSYYDYILMIMMITMSMAA